VTDDCYEKTYRRSKINNSYDWISGRDRLLDIKIKCKIFSKTATNKLSASKN